MVLDLYLNHIFHCQKDDKHTKNQHIYPLRARVLFSDKERERESGVGWQNVSGENGLLFKF